jgi:hypothetical protein
MQGLVGHKPGAVIDHEDESAGQKQEADKPEETADHASPYICRAGGACSPIPGGPEKFNLVSILCPVSGRIPAALGNPETVDGAGRALYKTPNGGGRNPAAAVL